MVEISKTPSLISEGQPMPPTETLGDQMGKAVDELLAVPFPGLSRENLRGLGKSSCWRKTYS